MTARDKSKFEKLFKTEVDDKEQEVDPEKELDWYALTVGWAIGKGIKPKDAHAFSCHIRYHTNLG